MQIYFYTSFFQVVSFNKLPLIVTMIASQNANTGMKIKSISFVNHLVISGSFSSYKKHCWAKLLIKKMISVSENVLAMAL